MISKKKLTNFKIFLKMKKIKRKGKWKIEIRKKKKEKIMKITKMKKERK